MDSIQFFAEFFEVQVLKNGQTEPVSPWIPDAWKKNSKRTYLIFDMDAGSLLDIIEFIIWLNIFFSYFSHFSIIIYGF